MFEGTTEGRLAARRILFLTVLLVLALALAGLRTASAQEPFPPSLPHTLYGVLTIDDVGAPDGTLISFQIDGVEFGTALTFTYASQPGTYQGAVLGDDPVTPGKEGGAPGDTVHVVSNGKELPQSIAFVSGRLNELNLTYLSHLFVASSGIDEGYCIDSGNACATIAFGNGNAGFGDTINLAGGNYDESILLAQDASIVFWPGGTVEGGAADWNVLGINISAGQLLAPPGAILLADDFVCCGAGSFTPGTAGLIFNGADTQYLSLDTPISLNNLQVGAGTLLVETASPNFVSADSLTNNGVIRKIQNMSALAPPPVMGDFGLTGVTMEASILGSLSLVQVDRIDANHPSATPVTDTGAYWQITTISPSDWTVTLTLPHANLSDPSVCEHLGGTDWNCARTGYDANSVSRAGVTSFSDWAVGNQAPTAITLTSLAGQGAANPVMTTLIAALALLAATTIGLLRRQTKGAQSRRG